MASAATGCIIPSAATVATGAAAALVTTIALVAITSNTDQCTSDPCANGGTCSIPNSDGYVCDCSSGWMGMECQIDMDECASSPCNSSMVCSTPNFNSYLCVCPSGWEGFGCMTDIDECLSTPCRNNGTCDTEYFDGYNCTCLAGYTGTRCEIDINECQSGPCYNGGTCTTPALDMYECSCISGWEGTDCEKDANECRSNPCVNGGSCVMPNFNMYRCNCPSGWDGINCERDYDECSSNPCLNNGTCETPSLYMYQCVCQYGWEGDNCEIITPPEGFTLLCDWSDPFTADLANTSSPDAQDLINTVEERVLAALIASFPNGTEFTIEVTLQPRTVGNVTLLETVTTVIIDQTNSTSAGSPANQTSGNATVIDFFPPLADFESNLDNTGLNVTATTFEPLVINDCAANPCLQNAVCLDRTASYECNCANAYSGPNCEFDADECLSNPCDNNGTCSTPNFNGYECACQDGWIGANCATDNNECHFQPCVNGGTCETPEFNTYNCSCPTGFEGPNCDTATIVQIDTFRVIIGWRAVVGVSCCTQWSNDLYNHNSALFAEKSAKIHYPMTNASESVYPSGTTFDYITFEWEQGSVPATGNGNGYLRQSFHDITAYLTQLMVQDTAQRTAFLTNLMDAIVLELQANDVLYMEYLYVRTGTHGTADFIQVDTLVHYMP